MPEITHQNDRVLDQFAQQAEAYSALVNKPTGPARDHMMEAIQFKQTDLVLDVGCGSGQLAVRIAPCVEKVVGVDLTPEMLAEATKHQQQRQVENVEWRLADAVALPVKDAEFDVVISRSMFHHAADPKATLREMCRACRPGGQVVVSDLAPAAEKAAAFDAIEALRDPSHARTHTTEELRSLGAALSLKELVVMPHSTDLPLEATLGTSFPGPGVLDRVRSLYARDAATGADAFGLAARFQDDVIWVTYPLTLLIWQKSL